jgi:tRNA pseudouridine55 synthase
MPSGILNVNKPPELTSFQVVSRVRGGTGVKRVGHAGTLDPMATGVLLICMGQATRISEYLMRLPKTYRARIALGVETDSYDAEGEVVATAPVTCSREDIEAALAKYAGTVEQTPPAHSAVKVGGRRAYHMARRGEGVALKPRPVRIDRIDLLSFEQREATIEIECGKGTYIRSLAHDIGRDLGCGAHVSALERTRVGPFTVESGLGTEELRAALEDGSWESHLLPMDVGLLELPEVTLHIEDEKDIRHGQSVQIDEDRLVHIEALADGTECRAYGEDGMLVALLRYEGETGTWRPRKVFPVEGEA